MQMKVYYNKGCAALAPLRAGEKWVLIATEGLAGIPVPWKGRAFRLGKWGL